MTRVLVVDDDPVQLRLTAEVANRAGFKPLTATGGEQALTILREDRNIGAMILDLVMPDLDGMGVMDAMRREGLTTPVIIQTANASLETVISAMRNGAADYFAKPVAPERLIISLRNAMKLDALEAAIRSERARKAGTFSSADMIAKAPSMARVLTLCAKAGKSTIPVLVEGETGTGKELIARIIQGSGDRAGKPFITVNCGAIPPNLIDSVLFGHKKGAFNGAVTDQIGKIAEAHNGTLFIDEVGELPLETQVKLLRVLQDGEIEPLGATRPERVNVRIISATNRRLLNLAKSGEFREDLYYRLNVFPIYVPPLRERMEDIPELIAMFIARFSAEAGKRVLGISPTALDLLLSYDWPGNIRQLENAVYRAIVLTDAAFLEAVDFPQVFAQTSGRDIALKAIESVPVAAAPTHIDMASARLRAVENEPAPAPDRFLAATGEIAALAEIERAAIVFAIEHHGGRMSRVARALKIGRSTLYRKLHEYGLAEDLINDAA
ncbi:DNA-binding transcriptional response regulator, NtrC family, contains REC, AAA-type ATPase, and a Fis-type DNA-binding domains [Devosia sp. YR412]|uniref:sigma-54-dependent transcriptional regulator n=1 Tax=Devosia sp. YR412 TaxID=1881030 RepID=UPI0008D83F58|nr:sigma-54 dependent transcriptional regulator [Devosia sp. YR412]SEQ14107.1 DNA-binding transcriptional response regulator, NtrC family, contains REC, AAA-type ATPase, and a Fis-type DNA-binding domains [Devosia sp. YR412]